MMRIRFTIGDSPIWHEIQIDKYVLSKQQFRDEHDLAHIIKNEQDKCTNGFAKKVEVIDENGNLLAKTPNILEFFNLEYK
jgi:hypothetical protein